MSALRDRAVEVMATAIHAGEDELVEPCDQCEQMAEAAYDALVAELGLREERTLACHCGGRTHGDWLLSHFMLADDGDRRMHESRPEVRLTCDWIEAPDA